MMFFQITASQRDTITMMAVAMMSDCAREANIATWCATANYFTFALPSRALISH